MMWLVIALAAAALQGCAHRAAVEQAHRWQVRGVVVALNGDALDLRHKSGRIVRLIVDDRTRFAGSAAAADGAVRPGVRVAADVEPEGGALHALRVQVFGGGPSRAARADERR